MSIAIVGAGMIGAAAARHLATQGVEVILIGPPEPEQKTAHSGPFASHYDQGRITRGLDPWAFWSRASVESIQRYGEIESQGGERFFSEVGTLMTGPGDLDLIRQVGEVATASGLEAERLNHDALANRFPYLAFPRDTIGVFEPANAGHINPRAMVRAQISAAKRAGARDVPFAVRKLVEGPNGVEIITDQGREFCDRVLVAAGGFTNEVLPSALPIRVFARTVALFELDADEQARLTGIPSMINLLPNGEDPYMLPPILYPDGKTYLKLGGDVVDVPLQGQALGDWFRSGGSKQVGDMLTRMIRERIPGLDIRSVQTDACVTTYTEADRPILQMLSDRIGVAVAGCGRGAKCSDELGRLGSEVVLGRDLPDWVERQRV